MALKKNENFVLVRPLAEGTVVIVVVVLPAFPPSVSLDLFSYLLIADPTFSRLFHFVLLKNTALSKLSCGGKEGGKGTSIPEIHCRDEDLGENVPVLEQGGRGALVVTPETTSVIFGGHGKQQYKKKPSVPRWRLVGDGLVRYARICVEVHNSS